MNGFRTLLSRREFAEPSQIHRPQVPQVHPDAQSPLFSHSPVRLIEVIPTDRLIEDWQNNLQIDITAEVGQHPYLYRYQCDRSLLQFYLPADVEGSGLLYKQLEKIDWYYMPHKWEHEAAMFDLKNCQTVLEVGAARGAFVDRLRQMGIHATGIELNLSAVAYAQAQHIPVEAIDLYQLAQEQPGRYDAVCTFQVLEHVSDPRQFVAALVDLVKPGGKLIIAVPNAQSFARHLANNLFDQPPHHMTRWSRRTFISLTQLFPLRVDRFAVEPLADYHVDWYLSIQTARFQQSTLWHRLNRWWFKTLLAPRLKSAAIRALIPGHTLYVCFRKLL